MNREENISVTVYMMVEKKNPLSDVLRAFCNCKTSMLFLFCECKGESCIISLLEEKGPLASGGLSTSLS